MSAVHWVCKKISLKSASEQLSATTISRQHRQPPASLTHAQTLPLAVRHAYYRRNVALSSPFRELEGETTYFGRLNNYFVK